MPKSNLVRADASDGNLRDLGVQFGAVEYKLTSNLKRYPRNPRRHPEKQIIKIAASIREFGFINPVVVNRRGEIINAAPKSNNATVVDQPTDVRRTGPTRCRLLAAKAYRFVARCAGRLLERRDRHRVANGGRR